ncbi:MAG: uncharacterized membrane protein YbaN (DUF454 family) [Candidatus Latescibacterota bacterium]
MESVERQERPYGRRWQRVLFFSLGSLCVGLATLGLVLPLLPTTPFLLLAAACYARSSKRFYDRLLANRIFGPTIRQWQENRSVALRTKIMAISLLAVTLGSSIVFFVPLWPVKILLFAVGVWVVQFLVRLPTTAAKSEVEPS